VDGPVKQVFGVFIPATAAAYCARPHLIFSNDGDPSAVAPSVQEQLKAGWYARWPTALR
jgi:hypothetical protein